MKELELVQHLPFAQLESLYKSAPNAKLAKRFLAILKLYLGKTIPETAALIHASAVSVRLWVHRWNTEGPDGLQEKPRSGRPPKLDPSQQAELVKTVQNSPKDVGYENSTWILKGIVDHVKKKYDQDYSLTGIDQLLKRKNLVKKVPRPMPVKADPKKK